MTVYPCTRPLAYASLQWRHNGRDSFSNHRPHDCLLNRLFRRRSKKTSKLRVTAVYEGNSPVTGEFPAQRASNVENVSIWWRHHVLGLCSTVEVHIGICCILIRQIWRFHRNRWNCTFDVTNINWHRLPWTGCLWFSWGRIAMRTFCSSLDLCVHFHKGP